ncbi:HDOD domain-containing protein [Thalassotalea atypica]|uniref:HDOD domain-containing protein n=1 Tax=Thalassotalea atypica TaxID=2054316 RepID=UPI002573E722|nr:HDOD domain-containing protein [Thalassotalea atypica]
MQLFTQNDTVHEIYQRSLSLAIGKEFAQRQNGDIIVTTEQGSEQSTSRRELLAVEQQAKKDKIIQAHGENHFRNQVMTKFFSKVTAELNTEFENKETFYQKFLRIEDAAPTILELLSLKAASINRITPLVTSLPWLADELIKLVNKPQYRKRADVKVTDASLAVSYIGLENLKLVVPTFILKHWLPISTSPFPLMKRKLWNDSLSVALASRVLAENQGIDWYRAFSAGMLSNVGLLAVTHCFITKFNALYNDERKQAYNNRDKRLHDALHAIQSSPQLLLEHVSSRSFQVGANLIEQMRFDRLPLTEPMFDLAFSTDQSQMCEIAKIITKAKAFVIFRSLAKEELINNDEAKAILSISKITAEEITLLKKSDIDHIKLNFK